MAKQHKYTNMDVFVYVQMMSGGAGQAAGPVHLVPPIVGTILYQSSLINTKRDMTWWQCSLLYAEFRFYQNNLLCLNNAFLLPL